MNQDVSNKAPYRIMHHIIQFREAFHEEEL